MIANFFKSVSGNLPFVKLNVTDKLFTECAQIIKLTIKLIITITLFFVTKMD